MALTPEEIEQHTFRERFRGYDPDEVDAFLDRVVGALRAAERERDAALAARDEAQQQTGESETLLRDTLVNAQRTAEQTLADARADADRIRQRAHEQAARIVADAQERARDAADAIEHLLGVHERLRESIRAVLAEHGDLLDRPGPVPPTAEQIEWLRNLTDQPVSTGDEDDRATEAASPVGWPEPPTSGDPPDDPRAPSRADEPDAAGDDTTDHPAPPDPPRFEPPPPR